MCKDPCRDAIVKIERNWFEQPLFSHDAQWIAAMHGGKLLGIIAARRCFSWELLHHGRVVGMKKRPKYEWSAGNKFNTSYRDISYSCGKQ